MVPRKTPRPSPNGRTDITEPLTNGDVVKVLSTLPGDQPFGVLQETAKKDFFRQLYIPLHSLFNTTTSSSQANRTKIAAITRLEVPPGLRNRFREFEENPLEFWESTVKRLPQYSNREIGDRARNFLMGAAQLDTNIEEQLIFRRFVAVSAYNLFRRVFPNSPESRVFTCNIAQFLVLTGLPTTDADIDKYGSIIRRGQRQMLICRKLKDDDPSSYSPQDNLISDDTSESMQDSDDYGLLFFSSIPDALWESGGLRGKDFDLSLEHLRNLRTAVKSETTNAKHMAKVLLDYHAQLVWVVGICPDNVSNQNRSARKKYPRKRQRTELPAPRTESESAPGQEDPYDPTDLDIDPLEFNLNDFDVIGPEFGLDDFAVVEP